MTVDPSEPCGTSAGLAGIHRHAFRTAFGRQVYPGRAEGESCTSDVCRLSDGDTKDAQQELLEERHSDRDSTTGCSTPSRTLPVALTCDHHEYFVRVVTYSFV